MGWRGIFIWMVVVRDGASLQGHGRAPTVQVSRSQTARGVDGGAADAEGSMRAEHKGSRCGSGEGF